MTYIREMIAVLTGDLMNSAGVETHRWMEKLKAFLELQGKSPAMWEIYRGDSFQFRCAAEEGFERFLLLKSTIRQIPKLDVRVAIGVGTVDFETSRITEANGTAFLHSGRTFDSLAEKQYLAFCTGREDLDRPLNLLAQFASLVMNNWSPSVAETVHVVLQNPSWSQQQVAAKLQMNQSAVSQNRKRGQLDLLTDLNEYYKTVINSLIS